MSSNKLQTAATVAVGVDLGMQVLKRLSGRVINGALLEGHEKKFSVQLRNALSKKETLK